MIKQLFLGHPIYANPHWAWLTIWYPMVPLNQLVHHHFHFEESLPHFKAHFLSVLLQRLDHRMMRILQYPAVIGTSMSVLATAHLSFRAMCAGRNLESHQNQRCRGSFQNKCHPLLHEESLGSAVRN